jgi:hypothetical protein
LLSHFFQQCTISSPDFRATIKLPHFDGEIMIREEELETTFLEKLYVEVTERNGNIRKLSGGLGFKQITLRNGEFVKLRVPDNQSKNYVLVRLVVGGYYVHCRGISHQ